MGDKLYNVRFVGDHFVTSATVWATNEHNAERVAEELLKEKYDWNVTRVSNEIEVERCK